MPKLPGRESTRKTIPLEKAMVASFLMPWEKLVLGKPCCIEGCEHTCDGRLSVTAGLGSQEFCGSNNAAAIYNADLMPGPKPDPFAGFACPHCVNKILDQDNRSLAGEPPGTGCNDEPPF